MLLTLKNVNKRYTLGGQTLDALKDISLEVSEGEFVSVMGPSGSGKSTFLQVSSMLAQPSSGNIFLKDKDVTLYDEVERARLRNREIGFIFQQFNLLPRTSAWENVALPLVYAGVHETQRKKRATEMLEKVGLGDRLRNTPAQLSGGQQQRVAVARALINEPSVIFADEPTGNLDSKASQDVKQLLINLHQEGKTIIMVTHEADDASIAKRFLLLKDGQLVADSPIKSITDIEKILKKRHS